MSKKYIADSFEKNEGTNAQMMLADGTVIPIPEGGSNDFVATGAIGVGDPVGLRSDGTVEVIGVGETGGALGTVVTSDTTCTQISTLFNPANGYYLIFQYNSTADDWQARTMDASTSPPTSKFNTSLFYEIVASVYAATYTLVMTIAIDFDGYEGVDVYNAASEELYYSYTGFPPLDGPTHGVVGIDLATEPSGYFIYAGENTTTSTLYLFTGDGYYVQPFAASTTYTLTGGSNIKIIYNPFDDIYIMAYTRASAAHALYARVITRTGANMSAGAEFAVGGYSPFNMAYDVTRGKVVVFQNNLIKTLKITGTTLSILDTSAPTVSISPWSKTTYHTDIKAIIVTGNGININSNNNTYYKVEWDGNAYTATSQVEYYGVVTKNDSIIYDTTNDKFVATWEESGNVKTAILTPVTATTNVLSTIGIADAAISNGVSGKINTYSGIDDNQSSLVPGEKYYVDYQGNIVTNPPTAKDYMEIGTAASTTEIIVEPE